MVFVFWSMIYLVLALAEAAGPQMGRVLYALAGVYGLAFFALVAGYFWARWFAVGLSLYGVLTAAFGMWQIGAEPVLLFVGGTHLAVTIMLWGGSMSASYDGQTAWRQRFHMDDNAVQRLGRSVIRAGLSLPLVLTYALAPKPDSASLVISIAALALTGLGLRALVQLRTWGVLAIGAAGVLLLGLAGVELTGSYELAALKPALGGSLLLFAAVPWLSPMRSWIARTV